MNLFLGVLFSFALTVTCAQQLDFEFDFENAKQTIQLLGNKSISQVELRNFLELHGTQALKKKLQSNNDAMQEAIVAAAAGASNASTQKFQYDFIAWKAKEWENFLDVLVEKQDSVKEILRSSFMPFLEPGKTYSYKVYFIMGGNSMGFTFGETDTFYVGLHRFKFDFQSVVLNCKHELFHNIQAQAYNPKKNEARMRKEGAGYEVVHALLNHLFREGSANYIEDFKNLKVKDTPSLRELKGHLFVNEYRLASLNLVLNRTLVDAFNNPKQVRYMEAYELLFDWNWNNPAYFAGEKMIEALVEAKGKNVLHEYLRKDAVYFVSDYVELSSGNSKKYPIQFTKEFSQMIELIKSKID